MSDPEDLAGWIREGDDIAAQLESHCSANGPSSASPIDAGTTLKAFRLLLDLARAQPSAEPAKPRPYVAMVEDKGGELGPIIVENVGTLRRALAEALCSGAMLIAEVTAATTNSRATMVQDSTKTRFAAALEAMREALA